MFEYYLFAIFILIAVVLIDQISKMFALKGVFSGVKIPLVTFGIVRNKGAMFGFLKSNKKILLLIHSFAIIFLYAFKRHQAVFHLYFCNPLLVYNTNNLPYLYLH